MNEVDDDAIRGFMLNLRDMKRMIFGQCLESVQLIWEDYIYRVARREADATKLSLVQRQASIIEQLNQLSVAYVQQAEDESEMRSQVDLICNAHHLIILQGLLPEEIDKWGHETNPKSEGTDILSFCATGVRIRMIKDLSILLQSLESELKPPKATIAESVHHDRTADYGQATVDIDPSAVVANADKHYSVSHVPLRAHGSRFVQWTKQACFALLDLDEGVAEKWLADNPTIPGESWTDKKDRNRRSGWWRLFFQPDIIEPMERKGYLLSSLECDGRV
jgi:hypothetical protein